VPLLIPVKLFLSPQPFFAADASTQTTEFNPTVTRMDLKIEMDNLQAAMIVNLQSEIRALLIGLGF
jgi:hypothetical protein